MDLMTPRGRGLEPAMIADTEISESRGKYGNERL